MKIVEFDFFNKKYSAIDNCELSVYLNENCNADCNFCIAQLRYKDRKNAFQKAVIKKDDDYFDQLNTILQNIPSFITSATITGGEPCLSSRLAKVVLMLRTHGFKRICLTTNGSFLLRRVNGTNTNLLSLLIDNGLTNLVLSRASHDEAINQSIMNFQYEPCTNGDIAKIVEIASARKINLRISGIFLKCGVCDLDSLYSFVTFYNKIGCRDFRFRELMDSNEVYMCNEEKINFCEKQRIDISQIVKMVEGDARFKLKQIIGGKSFFNNFIYSVSDSTLILQQEDLSYVTSQRANTGCIYGLVVHPNGDLASSWADGQNVMLACKTST